MLFRNSLRYIYNNSFFKKAFLKPTVLCASDFAFGVGFIVPSVRYLLGGWVNANVIGYSQKQLPSEKNQASIGTADDKAVYCIRSTLQKLYALVKIFNKLIGKAESL